MNPKQFLTELSTATVAANNIQEVMKRLFRAVSANNEISIISALYELESEAAALRIAASAIRSGLPKKITLSPASDNAETDRYQLPEECATACQEYAKVMLANNGCAPMRCRDGVGILRMQLPKGHAKRIKDEERRWKEQGIPSVPHITNGYPSPERDNIVIQYTDVCNLVELVRDYAYRTGYEKGFTDTMG